MTDEPRKAASQKSLPRSSRDVGKVRSSLNPHWRYPSRASLHSSIRAKSTQRVIPVPHSLRQPSATSVYGHQNRPGKHVPTARTSKSAPSKLSKTLLVKASKSGGSNESAKAKEKPESALERFVQDFTEQYNEIVRKIGGLKCDPKNENSKKCSKKELATKLAEIVVDSRELSRSLRNSNLNLPSELIRHCTNKIKLLDEYCEEARKVLLPRPDDFLLERKLQKPPPVAVYTLTSKTPNVDSSSPSTSAAAKKALLSTESFPSIAKSIDTLLAGSLFNLPTQLVTYKIEGVHDEYRLLSSECINDQFVNVLGLRNCLIEFRGFMSGVVIKDLRNCTLLFGPVMRTIFIEDMRDCKLAAACQYLRLHNTHSCFLYMQVLHQTTMSDCSKLVVAPYNYTYSHLEDDFAGAGFDSRVNNYTNVKDLNWLTRPGPSPNWRLAKTVTDKYPTNWTSYIEQFKRRLKASEKRVKLSATGQNMRKV